jgi:hypothetical protein
LKGPFWANYLDALGNYHGWADGDEFYVNYIGHPMEGAVAQFIFRQNDRKYQRAEFGQNAAYWKGQLRSLGYSFVYSAQFELGPVASEANIGHIQSYYPAQGFVDMVVTPSVGLGWTVAEDALDQYLVKYIERHTQNRFIRLLARGGLNPARSFANMIRLEYPWKRDDRPSISEYDPTTWKNLYANLPYTAESHNSLTNRFASPQGQDGTKSRGKSSYPEIPPFEIAFHADFMKHSQYGSGAGNLYGAGAGVIFNLNPRSGLVIDVSGAKMSPQGPNLSGDSLTYLIGPRFSFRPSPRYSFYADLLVGGTKLWQEKEYPEKKPPPGTTFNCGQPEADCEYWAYHETRETNKFTVAVGGGFEVAFNRVLAFRVCNLQYMHTPIKDFAQGDYSNIFRFSTGFIIRTGNW